jgi:hypothetical protein
MESLKKMKIMQGIVWDVRESIAVRRTKKRALFSTQKNAPCGAFKWLWKNSRCG